MRARAARGLGKPLRGYEPVFPANSVFIAICVEREFSVGPSHCQVILPLVPTKSSRSDGGRVIGPRGAWGNGFLFSVKAGLVHRRIKRHLSIGPPHNEVGSVVAGEVTSDYLFRAICPEFVGLLYAKLFVDL
jgi:hypothetical protein